MGGGEACDGECVASVRDSVLGGRRTGGSTQSTMLNEEEEKTMQAIRKLWQDEEGATAVEYGLMVALIAAVIIGAVTAIGVNLNTLFTTVAGAL